MSGCATCVTAKVRGPLRLVFIVASPEGLWQQHIGGEEPSYDVETGAALLVGVVLATSWSLVSYQDDGNACHTRMRALALKRVQSLAYRGFVENDVLESACVDEPMPLGANALCAPEQLFGMFEHRELTVRRVRDEAVRALSFDALLVAWRAQGMGMSALIAVIAPALAWRIMHERWSCLNTVALTARLNRRLLLDRTHPSAKRVSSFLRRVVGEGVCPRRAPASILAPRVSQLTDPRSPIKWVKACRFIKCQQENIEAATAFGEVWSCTRPGGQALDPQELATVSGELLQKARVRIDAVAMNMHRRYNRNHVANPTPYRATSIFVDASPQWRGQELYAATVDVRNRPIIHGMSFL